MIVRESRELIRRAKEGDTYAFADVFESLRSTVLAIAYRLVGPDDAEDVVMDTYLKAWKALPRFNERSAITTWLYRITHNCAIDFLRQRKRRLTHVLPEDDLDNRTIEDQIDDKQDAPSDILIRSEEYRLVRDAVAELDREHRVTLLLRYADGLSYKEIAASTGVSIGTVMSRLYNGKRKLRKLLS